MQDTNTFYFFFSFENKPNEEISMGALTPVDRSQPDPIPVAVANKSRNLDPPFSAE